MAFGFPARFKESRGFGLRPEALSAVVRAALEALGWPYTILPDGEFTAALHNSPATFGEAFSAKVLPDGVLQVESRCIEGGLYRMPQIFDFGANKKNVEAFFAQVERVAGKSVGG